MDVTKMELRGFKSFADKTTLVFDKGITAIVGPNGSGKSNISDAVRWVMGEQNVRQLRGQKAEDIIFAGTETRRPQGVAEVSLYFDNTDHSLETEYTEVVVTRRLFRSGDSEFYINKRPCRLKDIHQLFADTGIGQDSMAVIGQNRVDRILNSKPEERRVIFEEVAGISRYKGRKEEGLKKIAETERNLERIQDMMALLSERLEPMAAAAEKLKTFRRLDNERLAYEGTMALQELRNYERLVSKVENSRLTAIQEREHVSKEITAVERSRQDVVQKIEQEGRELRRLDEESLQAHRDLDSLFSRRQACQQRQEDLQRRQGELRQERDAVDRKEAQQEQQIQNLRQLVEQKETAWAAAKQGLALSENLFHEAEQQANLAGEKLANLAAARAQQAQELALCQRDTAELRRRLQENTEQYAQCRQEVQAYAAKQRELQQRAAQAKQRAAQEHTAWQTQQQALAAAQQEVKQAVTALTAVEQTYRQEQNRQEALQQRIRVLKSMEQEHEGLGRAVKVVLEANRPWQRQVCGVVGALCAIPEELTTAVDIALGGAARYVVTETEQAAKEAIAYLKERRAGRTTFLPLQTIRTRRRTDEEVRAAKEPEALGFASDLITYEPQYEAVFSSLLGKTILIRSVAGASQIARKYGYRLRLVCLDGTLFNPGGSLTGGSAKQQESSLINRRALLQSLQRQWQEANTHVTQAVNQGKTLRQTVAAGKQELARQEQAVHQTELARAEAAFALQQAEKEWQDAQAGNAGMQQRHDTLQQVRADIQAALVAKEAELEALLAKPATDTEELEQDKLAAATRVEQCQKAWTEQKVTVATLQEQARHSREQLAQYEQWRQERIAETAQLTARQQQAVQEQEQTAALLTQLQQTITAKEQKVQECDAAKETFYAAKEATFKTNQKLEEQLASLRQDEAVWRGRLNTADVQLEKYRAEVRRSEEKLTLQGLSRQDAMERRREGSLKELQGKVSSLREQIGALGQINPNAETEYTEAVEKEKFYQTQCADLRESRTKLEAIVAEIDTAMATQFTQAFGDIRGHFQQIFSRLFGGGMAHLVLTDTVNVLQSGVDIFIQPPGKKQQPLSLLSGGERALTVIALLLAFLAYHPAPFCLVDEVDAALDEANVERMARYLKNYSGQTQFIVITHRRKTMEAANTLQGVTMEEKGVSRLLTVKVDDVLEKGS